MPMNINGKRYGSLTEVSETLKVTTARLRQLCIQGRVCGAIKSPSLHWFVPLPARVLDDGRPGRKIRYRSA
jgi:hypothetical protein